MVVVWLLRVLIVIACAVIGGVIGLGGGFLLAMGVGWLSQIAHPDDPSAGSVAIIVIITAPVGLLGGVVAGSALGVALAAKIKFRSMDTPDETPK